MVCAWEAAGVCWGKQCHNRTLLLDKGTTITTLRDVISSCRPSQHHILVKPFDPAPSHLWCAIARWGDTKWGTPGYGVWNGYSFPCLEIKAAITQAKTGFLWLWVYKDSNRSAVKCCMHKAGMCHPGGRCVYLILLRRSLDRIRKKRHIEMAFLLRNVWDKMTRVTTKKWITPKFSAYKTI